MRCPTNSGKWQIKKKGNKRKNPRENENMLAMIRRGSC